MKQRPGSLRGLASSAPLTLVLLAACALFIAGCSAIPGSGGSVTGSGTPEEKRYDLSDFDHVHLDNGCQAAVTRGDAFGVTVTVDANLVQYLVVKVEDRVLDIGLDPNMNYTGDTLTAAVTLPDLQGLESSGAAVATVTGFSSEGQLLMELSGASKANLGGVTAGDVSVALSGGSALTGGLVASSFGGDVSGGSSVALQGSATAVKIEGSGGSHYDLRAFTAHEVDVTLSGASTSALVVEGTLNVDASGGSRLIYFGSPTLGDINTSGASQVTHGTL